MDGDWAAVRRAYEYGAEPASHIARTFGVNASTLHARKKREGWRRRGEAGEAGEAETFADEAGRADAFGALAHDLDRASTAVGRTLARLDEADAAGRERALKSLDLCLRAMEKIMTLKEREAELQGARETKAEGDYDEAGLRAELERRLARLAAVTGEGALSGEFESGGD